MDKRKEYFYLFLVLIFVSSTILYFFNVNQGYWWDEAVYLGLARNLYEGKSYQINSGQETFRPPLFPVTIAAIWKIFGFSEIFTRALSVIFTILSVFLSYIFGKKLYNPEVGLWAALIVGTTPMFVFFSEKILGESFFVFISLLALYTFYLAIEENKNYFFPVAGILVALSFLARYPGFILGIVYLLYPYLTRKKFDLWLRNPSYWLGIILFFILLIPWFLLSQANFGSPFGALFVQLGTIGPEFYAGPWYFYFRHWIEIFGLVGVFVVPTLIKIVLRRKNQDIFILLSALLVTSFFMFISRKEMRYLIAYLPIYATIFAFGICEFRKWINSKRLLPIIVVIFVLINWVAGLQMILNDITGGEALKQAGLYLSKIVPENTMIMTQNMPVIHYTTNREIVYFPEEQLNLKKIIKERNVSFIVIEAREPTYPNYVWQLENGEKKPSKVFDSFVLERSFEENSKTLVWIYRVS